MRNDGAEVERTRERRKQKRIRKRRRGRKQKDKREGGVWKAEEGKKGQGRRTELRRREQRKIRGQLKCVVLAGSVLQEAAERYFRIFLAGKRQIKDNIHLLICPVCSKLS